jgi:hypothetical protein
MSVVGILLFFLNERPFVWVDGREKSIGIGKSMVDTCEV